MLRHRSIIRVSFFLSENAAALLFHVPRARCERTAVLATPLPTRFASCKSNGCSKEIRPDPKRLEERLAYPRKLFAFTWILVVDHRTLFKIICTTIYRHVLLQHPWNRPSNVDILEINHSYESSFSFLGPPASIVRHQ